MSSSQSTNTNDYSISNKLPSLQSTNLPSSTTANVVNKQTFVNKPQQGLISGGLNVSVSNNSNINNNLAQPQAKTQLSVSDFYKSYIMPVIIPLHYCCTPLLFYPNWNDIIMTEHQLKINSTNKLINNLLPNIVSKLDMAMGVNNNSTKPIPPSIKNQASLPAIAPNEAWYLKMRQIVLVEYSRYHIKIIFFLIFNLIIFIYIYSLPF